MNKDFPRGWFVVYRPHNSIGIDKTTAVAAFPKREFAEEWIADAPHRHRDYIQLRQPNCNALATAIASALFTNGAGTKADRLVMELKGSKHDGGGWCFNAARNQVLSILESATPEIPNTPSKSEFLRGFVCAVVHLLMTRGDSPVARELFKAAGPIDEIFASCEKPDIEMLQVHGYLPPANLKGEKA